PIADLRRGALEELLERQSSGERRGLSGVGRVGSRVAGAPGGGYAAATNVRGPLVVRSARRTAPRGLVADAAVHELVRPCIREDDRRADDHGERKRRPNS